MLHPREIRTVILRAGAGLRIRESLPIMQPLGCVFTEIEMTATTTDRIEKSIELKAPVSRVWRAITDYREFSEWFNVRLESPFEEGKTTVGRITHPGYEHMTMQVVVKTIEPEKLFSYYWHPYAVDMNFDYSREPMTLVEFRFEEIPDGTLLTITESGFDSIPAERREEAFRMNSSGWTAQSNNIAAYVASHP
jgi:uncharacterized protein YndB with AHSA1/START domain